MGKLSKAERARKTEIDARWREANRDKRRAYDKARRERIKALERTFTARHWRLALEYWDGRCAYCGNRAGLFDSCRCLHQDHFIPVSRGGSYSPANIVPCCAGCNFSKGDSDPVEWLLGRFHENGQIVLERLITYFAWIATQG